MAREERAAPVIPAGDDRICLIQNPVAGPRRLDMEALMARADRRFRLFRTAGKGDATTLAREAARAGFRIVVAAGGDGTVNEVATGLLGTDAALAIVPLGSGNGLARHFRVSRNPARALAGIGAQPVRRMDVGRINGQPFFCTAGIGFDADVSRHFAESRTRGLRTYVATTLARYRRFRPGHIRLETGERALDSGCFLLAFANASEYGNGARIAPRASVFDGRLDLCLLPDLPLWRAPLAGWALMTGTFDRLRGTTFLEGVDARVTADREMAFHVDGDFAGVAARFEVAVERGGLRVAM